MERPLLLLDVACPHCGATLTREGHIHLLTRDPATGREGALRPSAVFGDTAVALDLELPPGTVLDLRCPDCDESLAVDAPCPQCGAPLVSLELSGSGEPIDLCPRLGCPAQNLGGPGDPDEMYELVNRVLKTPQDW